MFTRGLRELKDDKISIILSITVIGIIIADYIKYILLESKLDDNKEQARLGTHNQYNHEDILKLTTKQPTAPKEILLYLNISTLTEKIDRHIQKKIAQKIT